MRIKYLSGPYAGYEETIDNLAYAEQLVAFGYAERVRDWPPRAVAEPDPQLITKPPAEPDPPAAPSGGFISAPSPSPAGGPAFDP